MSIKVMSWVFENSEATLGARLVLLALADYAHDDGSKAFPSVETLMEHTRMSRRAVYDALKRLEADGHVRRSGATKTGTVIYSILGITGADTAPRAESARRGADTARRGAGSARSATDSAPDPLTNHQGTTSDPPAPPDGGDSSSLSSQTREIFDHWKATMGLNGNTRLTADRRQKVMARLKEGLPVEEIKRAIEGVAASEYHRAHNHDDLELICRKGSNVQRYAKFPLAGENLNEHQREVAAALARGPEIDEDEVAARLASVGLAVA